jgi:hypothetical protein
VRSDLSFNIYGYCREGDILTVIYRMFHNKAAILQAHILEVLWSKHSYEQYINSVPLSSKVMIHCSNFQLKFISIVYYLKRFIATTDFQNGNLVMEWMIPGITPLNVKHFISYTSSSFHKLSTSCCLVSGLWQRYTLDFTQSSGKKFNRSKTSD